MRIRIHLIMELDGVSNRKKTENMYRCESFISTAYSLVSKLPIQILFFLLTTNVILYYIQTIFGPSVLCA